MKYSPEWIICRATKDVWMNFERLKSFRVCFLTTRIHFKNFYKRRNKVQAYDSTVISSKNLYLQVNYKPICWNWMFTSLMSYCRKKIKRQLGKEKWFLCILMLKRLSGIILQFEAPRSTVAMFLTEPFAPRIALQLSIAPLKFSKFCREHWLIQ